MLRTSNPTFKEDTFDNVEALASVNATPMTLGGTISKTVILLAILVTTAFLSWEARNPALILGGFVVSLILFFVILFKRNLSPYLAPAYAAAEGLWVGGLSAYIAEQMVNTKYPNAVPLAVLGTMATLAIMLGLYVTRVIKVNQTFFMVVVGATAAVGLTYLLTLFIPAMRSLEIYQSSPIGIGFSVFVIILAALNFALDFNIIETGIQRRAPKYMEWYCGFALLVTMVWLYLEILRLLSKLARR